MALALLGVLAAVVVRIRVPGSFVPAVRDFLPLLGYGLPCVLTTLPQVMNFRLDQMVMTGLFRPLELGLYVAAVSWSAAINPLLYALASALFPEVASKAKEHERVHAFVRGARLAALAAIILGVAVTLATPWAITILFGAGFRAAIPSGLILVPAGAIAAWEPGAGGGFARTGPPGCGDAGGNRRGRRDRGCAVVDAGSARDIGSRHCVASQLPYGDLDVAG